MPKGKPGLMLSQNGLESSRSDSNQYDQMALPDEISNLVFELERDPVKPLPHISLDDSGFLKNGRSYIYRLYREKLEFKIELDNYYEI